MSSPTSAVDYSNQSIVNLKQNESMLSDMELI